MGIPKFRKKTTTKVEKKQSRLKDSSCPSSSKSEAPSINDKLTIEQYRAKIAEMLKDPQNSKKAAMIIEELLKISKKKS